MAPASLSKSTSRAITGVLIIAMLYILLANTAFAVLIQSYEFGNASGKLVQDVEHRKSWNFTINTTVKLDVITVNVSRVGSVLPNRYIWLNISACDASALPSGNTVAMSTNNRSQGAMPLEGELFNYTYSQETLTPGTYCGQLFDLNDDEGGASYATVNYYNGFADGVVGNFNFHTPPWTQFDTTATLQYWLYGTTDTCTAPASGTWVITDNCNLNTPQVVPGDIVFTSPTPQHVTLSSRLRFSGTSQRIIINSGSTLEILPGGSIG